MKKNWITLVSCWTIFLLLLGGSKSYQTPNEQILEQLLQKLQAESKQNHYHFSGRVNDPIPKHELDHWVKRFTNALSLHSLKKQNDVDGIRYEAKKSAFGLHYQLQMVIDHPNNSFVRPFIVLIVRDEGMMNPDWLRLKEAVSSQLHSFGIYADYHVSSQWELQTAKDLQAVVDQALTFLAAKPVEGMVTDRTLSVSAQSPLLSGKLKTGTKWMNVQIAARWSDDHSKMIVTVGSPIITMEY